MQEVIKDKEELGYRLIAALEDIADMIDTNFSEMKNLIRQKIKARHNFFWSLRYKNVEGLEIQVDDLDSISWSNHYKLKLELSRIQTRLSKIFNNDHELWWVLKGFQDKVEKAIDDLNNYET